MPLAETTTRSPKSPWSVAVCPGPSGHPTIAHGLEHEQVVEARIDLGPLQHGAGRELLGRSCRRCRNLIFGPVGLRLLCAGSFSGTVTGGLVRVACICRLGLASGRLVRRSRTGFRRGCRRRRIGCCGFDGGDAGACRVAVLRAATDHAANHHRHQGGCSHYRKPRRTRSRRSLDQILLTCRPQIDLQTLLAASSLKVGIAVRGLLAVPGLHFRVEVVVVGGVLGEQGPLGVQARGQVQRAGADGDVVGLVRRTLNYLPEH